jgi:hypothetical protein
MAEVRVGQVWASNDWRDQRKNPVPTFKVHVITHYGDPAKSYATVMWEHSGRRSRILLRRFRPNSTGYRLVEDAPEPGGDE